MAGDELMKTNGLPKTFVWFFAGILIFLGFNYWLMREVGHIAGNPLPQKNPPAELVLSSGAHIPRVDPSNDLLAPVDKVESPQIYLKRRPQKNTEERVYGIPKSDGLITQ